MVDSVMEGRLDNGFTAVRPPGHHAEADRAMGFCLFNNVSVAARHLIERHGTERVLIVDWDVHHGNGTQNAFYDDDRVLFASLHQYPFYPGTGRVEEIGEGRGEGCTINVPFPGGFGDSDYMLAFERVIIPIARKFAPEFVLISAGFDSHWSDPLASMQVTEDAFSAMTKRLLAVAHETAKGRLVAVLEGGYNLDALAICVERTLVAMQSFDPSSTPAPVGDHDSMAEGLLSQVAGMFADKWGI
jgi:acetoin utilization deacetylase AcuC-like enzyme